MRLLPYLTAALVSSLVSLAIARPAVADVWTWKDAAGEPHYSDRPVDGATRVPTTGSSARGSSSGLSSSTGGSSSAASSGGLRDPKSTARNDADATLAKQRAEAAVQQDLAKKQEDQCKQAKAAYDNSIAARRIIKTGSQGESGFMTDAEADEYRVKAHSEMDAACTNGKG